MQTFFWILSPRAAIHCWRPERLVLNAYVTALVLRLNRSSRRLLRTQSRLCSSIGHFHPANFSSHSSRMAPSFDFFPCRHARAWTRFSSIQQQQLTRMRHASGLVFEGCAILCPFFFLIWHTRLQSGDHFNLYHRILRQTRHLHGRARRRRRREILAIHFVHGCKFVHVLQKNRCLYDVMEIRSRRFQNSLHVFEHPLRLLANVYPRHLARFRIQRHLPRKVQKSIRSNRLRIRSDGFRSPVGQNDVSHRVVSFSDWAVTAAVPVYRARNSSGTPGRFIHIRTNSAAFWCVSCSKAAIRSLSSKLRSLRAYNMWLIAFRNTSRP